MLFGWIGNLHSHILFSWNLQDPSVKELAEQNPQFMSMAERLGSALMQVSNITKLVVVCCFSLNAAQLIAKLFHLLLVKWFTL